MEKRLQKGNSAYNAAADARELGLQLATSAAGPLTTRERIGRDRDLHRLNLHTVEGVPRDVLVHTVQVIRCYLYRHNWPHLCISFVNRQEL